MQIISKGRKNRIIALSMLGLMSALPLGATLGIKGGLCVSGLQSATGDYRHFFGYELDGLSMGNLTGYQAGLFATFDLSTRLQLQPEIYYALRGGDAGRAFVYDDIVYRIKIAYVELPLLLKYRVMALGSFSMTVLAGPYAALKLLAEKRTRVWKEDGRAGLENVKSLDYGLLLGLGLDYDVGFGHALLELRSGLGLHSIMDALPGTVRLYPDRDHIRNFYISVMMGYAFK